MGLYMLYSFKFHFTCTILALLVSSSHYTSFFPKCYLHLGSNQGQQPWYCLSVPIKLKLEFFCLNLTSPFPCSFEASFVSLWRLLCDWQSHMPNAAVVDLGILRFWYGLEPWIHLFWVFVSFAILIWKLMRGVGQG